MPKKYIFATTLLATLWLSSTAFAALPATCFNEPFPEPRRQPGWHILLPSLSFGVDFRPQQTLIANTESRHQELIRPQDPTSENGVHQAHQDELMRWTLALSWTGQHPPHQTHALPPTSPRLLRCQELFALRAESPADLSSAIEHWAQTQTLQALLEPGQPGEVPR